MRRLTTLFLVIPLLGVAAIPVTAQPPTTTDELLAGMVTEEVEPGVLRIVNDGYRDLAHPDEDVWREDAVIVGAAGDVWRITPPRHLFRLGQEPEWDYEPGLVDIGQANTEASLDGRLWTLALRGLRVFDGETWTQDEYHYSGDGGVEYYIGGDWEAIEMQDDGTVWLLDDEFLAALRPGREPDDSAWADVYDGWVLPTRLSVTDDGEAWLAAISDADDGSWAFLRFDGTDWQVVLGPDGVSWVSSFDVGPHGPLWTAGDSVRPHRNLARHDDAGWTIFTEANGVRPWGGQQADWWDIVDTIEVAPDGSVWVNATGGPADTCDGLARFDGETWTSYLTGRCISDLDFAPDGSVWLVAREPEGVSEVNTYVITPEAVAATE
jgi:hypothetical protein